ncbi:hypothetical protein PS1_007559 [Malus domestica]
MSLGLFLPLIHHWRRLSSSSSLPLSIHPPTECFFFISSDGDICSSTKTKTTEISPKCSSKSAFHSLLQPLGCLKKFRHLSLSLQKCNGEETIIFHVSTSEEEESIVPRDSPETRR